MRSSLVLLLSLSSAAAPDECGVFTVDDLLHVANATIADVSADGRWAALTVSSLDDRIGIDNRRFGDPTYIAPHKMDVLVVDTQSGAATSLFENRTQVKGLKFSPDGKHLAMFALRSESFALRIWDHATGNFSTVTAPEGKAPDDAGEMRWTRDGTKLILPLRAADWKERVREKFLAETVGPVIFHSSTEPFLAWIGMRRLSLEESIGAYDTASAKVVEIAPPSLIAGFSVAEDASYLIVNNDIAKKTEYETLGAGEARGDLLPTGTGAKTRTLIPSTKGVALVWSRDLHSLAYSKDGAVYFSAFDTKGLTDKEPRLIAGKKKEDTPKDPEQDASDNKAKKESYTAERISPKGDYLVASSQDGLWVVDTATGKKELFVKMPEEDKLA